MTLHDLHAAIAAVCPIVGINSSGFIVFSDAATNDQRTAAQALMADKLPMLSPHSGSASVSPWQLRKALNQLGWRAAVEALVEQSQQDIKDGWEFATEFQRNNQFVVSMGQALGKTDAEMDALFALAATL